MQQQLMGEEEIFYNNSWDMSEVWSCPVREEISRTFVRKTNQQQLIYPLIVQKYNWQFSIKSFLIKPLCIIIL